MVRMDIIIDIERRRKTIHRLKSMLHSAPNLPEPTDHDQPLTYEDPKKNVYNDVDLQLTFEGPKKNGAAYNDLPIFSEGPKMNKLDATSHDLPGTSEVPKDSSRFTVHYGNNSLVMEQEIYLLAKRGDVDGFLAALERVSEEKKIHVNTILCQLSNPEGNTYLHVAAVSGNVEIVEFIVQHFPELMYQKNNGGYMAIHLAARAGHLNVIKYLVSLSDLSGSKFSLANSMFHGSVKNFRPGRGVKDFGTMGKFLSHDGSRPLYEALRYKQSGIVKYLLDIDVTASYYVNAAGLSALHEAVANGEITNVKKMLRSGREDYYLRDKVLRNNYADRVLEAQLMKGRDFHLGSGIGMDNAMLQEILGNGLHMLLFKRINELSVFSSPVFDQEVKTYLSNEFFELINRMVPLHAVSCSTSGMKDESASAVWDERQERIRKILHNYLNHDLVEKDVYDRSMHFELYKASASGDVDGFISALEILSEEKGLPLPTILSQLSPLQNSFLHVAASYGNDDLTKFILHYFPNLLSWTNRKGDTALHLAVRGGQVGVVGIIVRFRNDHLRKEYAMDNEIESNDAARVQNMLERVAVENDDGKTPLMEALLLGRKEVAAYMIKQNVEEAYYVNKKGISALYISVIQNDVSIVKAILSTSSYFVDQGVLHDELIKGKPLPHAAILSTNLAMVQAVAQGIPMLINVKDEYGQNPVPFAELLGFHGMAKYLCDEFKLGTEIVSDAADNAISVFPTFDPNVLSHSASGPVDLKLQNIRRSMHHNGRYRRMKKLIDYSFHCSTEKQLDKLIEDLPLCEHPLGTRPPCPYCHDEYSMDRDLFESAKKGDVDGFISALEKVLDDNNSSLYDITNHRETEEKDTFLHLSARFGHEELSGFLIYYFPDFLIRRNSDGNTALHLAARYGLLGVVDILVSFMNYDRRMLLSLTDDIPCIFGVKMKRCNFLGNNTGNSPLHEAFYTNQEKSIEYLIKENVHEAYLENIYGKTGLYLAVMAGNIDYVRTMFSATSMSTFGKLLPQPKMTKSLLHVAIDTRNIEMLQELSKRNPKLLNIKEGGLTPLQYAERIGYEEGSIFLCYGMMDTDTEQVVVAKNLSGHIQIPAPLPSKKLDNTAESNVDISMKLSRHTISRVPSHSVVTVEVLKIENIRPSVHWEHRHERLKKILERTSVQDMHQPAAHEHRAFYKAAMKGDVDEFITALEKYSEEKAVPLSAVFSEVSPLKNTLLHVAASSGNEELLGFIVHHFRNLLNEINHKGDTALHMAARGGHLGVVEILVRFTIDQLQKGFHDVGLESNNVPQSVSKTMIGNVNKEGNTALHEAMINNHEKVAEYLIKEKVEDAFHLNNEEKSAIYMAVEAGNIRFVKNVLKNTYVNAPELNKGRSLIHAAISRRNIAMLELIVNQGTELRLEDGQNPLDYAASTGFLEGVNCLLKFGNTSEKNTKGWSPVHLASRNGHLCVLRRLLQHFPDARELMNNKGQNFLHIAAEFGQDNVVRFILKTPGLEVLINDKDEDGNTPLHLATINWHPMVVSSLTWDKRTNLKMVNGEGLTALEAAEESMETVTTFRQRLTWSELVSAGVPRAMIQKIPSVDELVSDNDSSPSKDKTAILDNCKDRVNTLLLVSTLVATVTFAAGFTMPGGNNNSEPNEGLGTMLSKQMFQVFVVCDTIAMYSAIIVVVSLIWAQLGDLALVGHALKLALPLLGLSLTMMSAAFLAGVHLAVNKLSWIADFVLITASISVASILTLFIPLCFSYYSNSRVVRYMLYHPSRLLILVTGSYGDPRL